MAVCQGKLICNIVLMIGWSYALVWRSEDQSSNIVWWPKSDLVTRQTFTLINIRTIRFLRVCLKNVQRLISENSACHKIDLGKLCFSWSSPDCWQFSACCCSVLPQYVGAQEVTLSRTTVMMTLNKSWILTPRVLARSVRRDVLVMVRLAHKGRIS